MKKLIFLFVILSSVLSINAQEDLIQPKKFASWTISNAFQAEAGFAGSYWKPTFNIAKDHEGYYCVVNLYNPDGYYSIDNENLPHLYLKTKEGNVIDLEMDGDEPVHKFYLKGYYVSSVWMPGRYVTRFIYYISNVEEFFSNYYVKYRIWLGENFKDVELSKGYADKFNKRLNDAKIYTDKKYKSKTNSLNNPLEGF